MSVPDRYAGAVTRYSKVVVAVMLVATLVVGSAAGDVESGINIASFASDSTEAQKLDYVRENFSTAGENTTSVQVVFRAENALSKEALLAELRLQRSLRGNATVKETLADRQFVGLSNLVATAAIRQERARERNASGGPPTGGDTAGQGSARPATPGLDAQIEQLESMSAAEVERVVADVLAPDASTPGGVDPYTLLPTDYEPGSTEADARVMFVFQSVPGDGGLPDDVADAQLTVQTIAENHDGPGTAFAFGTGIVDAEATAATGESFAVITPFAFLIVVAVLLYSYRDLLDVVLGLVGVVLVLVWMGGFMGWAGIGVTQIIIAVPFLLIGLSIDYALHVVMRYREARADGADAPRSGMRRGLAGVVVALGATTFTTAVGFLANLTSPIGSIREFAAVSAAGIVSAFLVFALLLPALKLELESLLERAGLSREKRAFGRSGAASRLLGVGTTVARVAPAAVVVVGLLVAGAGGYAATDIETSIDQVDFLPRDSPEWMESLPAGLAPSDYSVRADAIYLNDNFLQDRDSARVEILIEGAVTDPGTLDGVAAGREAVGETDSAVTLGDDEPRVTGPLSVMRDVARDNESFNATFTAADTDGDGVPDRDLEAVYDELYRVAPDRAERVVHREDGRYRALRMQVAVQAGADSGLVTEEMRAVAATVEGDAAVTATATGQPIVDEIVQQGLLRTLVQGFVLTLGVILGFLTLIFRRRHGTLSLGAVTLVPVVFALAWILGTMYLLGIPFNTETAIITSIAIGIGVDYAIHVSERFVEELDDDPFAALDRTLAGTGGALLASATTTAAGFGVLTLALVPSLQRFGTVTGLTIVYAFVASVVVLPSLLVLWTRYAGPERAGAGTEQPTD
jgi:predicted RND superfamily exporter protein